MSASYTYRYMSLRDPSRKIRLLKVNSSGDKGALLTGTLSRHTIPQLDATRRPSSKALLGLPVYFALSYVWGTGSGLHLSHEIILDGRRFPITAHLHTALLTFRSRNVASCILWVDAICINQADSHEKSAQISIMPDIYHFALAVVVWLGEDTAETTRVKEFMKKLVFYDIKVGLENLNHTLANTETEYKDGGQQKRPWTNTVVTKVERVMLKGAITGARGLFRGVRVGYDAVANYCADFTPGGRASYSLINIEKIMSWSPNEKQRARVRGEDFQEMAALIDRVLFSDNQYFSRMWTLQEVCAANDGQVTILGMNLGELLQACYYMQREFGTSSSSVKKITALLEVNTKFNSGEILSLRELLALSAGRKSGDPRDRIYALQGLMTGEINPLLQPDYTKSVAEVYSNTTYYIISAERSLDIICGQQLHDRLPELPSWVPDFRCFGLERGTLVDARSQNSIYLTSLSEDYLVPENPFQLRENWQTLTVTGICLGTVSVLSDILVLSGNSQTERFSHYERLWAAKLIESQEWRRDELEAISRVSDLVGRYVEFYQNSNRATFWSRNPDKLQKLQQITEIANNEIGSAFDLHAKYLLTLLCGRMACRTRCGEEELLKQMRRLCIADQEGIEALENLCKALDNGTQGRRLIVSDERQIGAASETTRKGDKIYVLIGCSVPVILRDTERANEFEFVGECYWHGFMDGEALAIRDGDKVTAHEFKMV